MHMCFARLCTLSLTHNTRTHTHKHEPPSSYFAGGWSKRDSVCHLKSPASSQCRSCVLQTKSPDFSQTCARNQNATGACGIIQRRWQVHTPPPTPPQSLLQRATQKHKTSALLNLGQLSSRDRSDLFFFFFASQHSQCLLGN